MNTSTDITKKINSSAKPDRLIPGPAVTMYLHLGKDHVVPLRNVVSIFDMDTATTSKRTRKLLTRLQDEGRIVEACDDLPRSAVLCEDETGEILYLTEMSSKALQKRTETALF